MAPQGHAHSHLIETAPVPKYQILHISRSNRTLSRVKYQSPRPPSPDYLASFDQVKRYDFGETKMWVLVQGPTLSQSALYALARHARANGDEWQHVDLSQL